MFDSRLSAFMWIGQYSNFFVQAATLNHYKQLQLRVENQFSILNSVSFKIMNLPLIWIEHLQIGSVF